MSSFSTYLLGFIVLTAGLALGAYLLNVPPLWILAGVIALVGIGILMATSRTKTRDIPRGGTGPGYGGGYGGTGHGGTGYGSTGPGVPPTGTPGTNPPPPPTGQNRPPGGHY